ncbi:MAG: helix-turn-helix domain-containing protein [Pseudomonadota bacterium]
MLDYFILALTGYSIFGMAILLVGYYLFFPALPKPLVAVVSCTSLLLSLVGIQCFHWHFFVADISPAEGGFYSLLLLVAPPSFYFFSREVLMPERRFELTDLIHFLPLVLTLTISPKNLVPYAFVLGTAYAFWFARVVWLMRAERHRFRAEMFFFALFALLAVVVLVFGLTADLMPTGIFFAAYALAIGSAVILVQSALLFFPALIEDIKDAASATYATSTLGSVDVEASIVRLQRAMDDERCFEDESLNLRSLAGHLELQPHQLSELINTHFGVGFSKFLRGRRVEAAKTLLERDPSASVLSVGLSVGFRSQSNFYTAFRAVTGSTPGEFRAKTRKDS